MKRLVFATNNRHKLHEVRAALGGSVQLLALADVGLAADIPETAPTLEGNAQQKAEWVYRRLDLRALALDGVFADDTGLEVAALGGAPGVYSARYAGEHCSFDDNIDKLLRALHGIDDRRACFRTVICLLSPAPGGTERHLFEGRIDGTILTRCLGDGGFGYDPVFMPDRFAVSFAEMPLEVKNSISHRGLAVEALKQHLVP
ncbi:MAG: RdgB/HAM1 family non-canonical purine NTP pyrophosphatase [Bacteroidales bacterium]|nr:RdgB/HAM1 family non-canonical purine NTP pyrophosphatase [Bacteroidales bacterium]